MRGELDRQTDILRASISGAKDETISTLKAECRSRRDENASLQEQHAALKNQAKEIEAKLEDVRERNLEMSQILSTKYTARALFLGSSFIVLSMVGALAFHFLRGVTVVDPYFAGVVLAVAIGFTALAGVRSRQKGTGRRQ